MALNMKTLAKALVVIKKMVTTAIQEVTDLRPLQDYELLN